jgi:hypothetical protein
MNRSTLAPLALVVALLAGCTDNPAAPALHASQSPNALLASGDGPPPPTNPTYSPSSPTTSQTVSSMETDANAVNAEIMAPPTAAMFYVADGDGWPGCGDLTECQMACLGYKIDFANARTDFWYADNEYWEFVLTGRSYLTGRAVAMMTASLYTMKINRDLFKSNYCSVWLMK